MNDNTNNLVDENNKLKEKIKELEEKIIQQEEKIKKYTNSESHKKYYEEQRNNNEKVGKGRGGSTEDSFLFESWRFKRTSRRGINYTS